MRREWLVPLVRIIAVAAFSLGIAAFLWLGVGSQRSTPVSAATFQIQVGDNWFCDSSFQGGDCETNVAVGDQVTWDFSSASATHTTTECTGSCGSPIGSTGSREWHFVSTTGDSFSRSFNTPGTFEYQCNIHPTQMRGTIIVGGGVPTPPTLPMPPSPLPTETETPFPTLPMPPSPVPSVTATPFATLPMPPSPVPSTTATLAVPATPVPSDTATTVPTDTPEPAPTSTPSGLLGDVNGDAMVDAIDAALVLQFVAAFFDSISNGDVNEDGTTNSIDAALILQFTAGLLNSLPP
ncbi:MAG: hypothetical protein IH865_05510 [Chloroflexi bacterium]|nr:hypothetical protein [Chloroflexota bacterium]